MAGGDPHRARLRRDPLGSSDRRRSSCRSPFFGFGLCLLYQRTGSLYPCIALHAINNCVAFGVTQDWTWEIPLLVVLAAGVIALRALAVQRVWTPARAPARACARWRDRSGFRVHCRAP